MLTPKFRGYFNCRKYDQSGKLAHDQRQMLADTDNITVAGVFALAEVPDVFRLSDGSLDAFVRLRASRSEREKAQAENRQPNNDQATVSIKIAANCRWFDKFGNPCSRPTNADLEARRYNVQVEFTRKAKVEGNPLAPSGYWANAIMFEEVMDNPFAGQAFAQSAPSAPTAAPMQPVATQTFANPAPAAPATMQGAAPEPDDDLPF